MKFKNRILVYLKSISVVGRARDDSFFADVSPIAVVSIF